MAPTTGPTRPRVGGAVAAVGAGVLSGALGAYGYYDPLLRPVAHTVGLWLVVVLAVAAGRPLRPAIVHATAALLGAVVAFFVGKKVVYALRHPGGPYPLDYAEIGLWLVLAVVAGVTLGWAWHHIGRPGRPAPAATASSAGLLLADAIRRGHLYPDDIPVTATVAVVGLVVLAVLAREDRPRTLSRAALLTVPATLVALLLVSAPDVVEQLVLVGS